LIHPFVKLSEGAGLLLGDIKGLWHLALVLSSVLPVPLDEASAQERANNCLLIETAILRLGKEFDMRSKCFSAMFTFEIIDIW